MQHPDNAARGASALGPFQAFVAERQLTDESGECQVGDLISNLMHLCDTCGVNPIEAARLGVAAYLQEAIDPDALQTDARVEFKINGKEEFIALATIRPSRPSPVVCNSSANPPACEGAAQC